MKKTYIHHEIIIAIIFFLVATFFLGLKLREYPDSIQLWFLTFGSTSFLGICAEKSRGYK